MMDCHELPSPGRIKKQELSPAGFGLGEWVLAEVALMMSPVILFLSDKTPGGRWGEASQPPQPPDCVFYNGHMPRAGLGANGALNYGEAEFQIFQIHLPVCILQLQGCKQERDKRRQGRELPSGTVLPEVAFPLENNTASSCRAIRGPRCRWVRGGEGDEAVSAVSLTPSSTSATRSTTLL